MELNNLTKENILKLIKKEVNLLLTTINAYINIDIIYFEIKHRNRLIYISIHIEIKNNKMLYSRNWITITSLISKQ